LDHAPFLLVLLVAYGISLTNDPLTRWQRAVGPSR
jgi:hypothetical protein